VRTRAASAATAHARLGSLRETLIALGGTLGALFVTSLAAALGVPSAPLARIVIVGVPWAALALLLAFLFLPGFDPVPARTLRRAPSTAGRAAIALTFDDGPHPETTPALLDALAAAGARATFFLVGEQARRHPELARRIAAAGHAIGNHTQRHRLLAFRARDEIADEISACQATLAAVLGARPSLFRTPHGFKAIGLGRLLAREGLRSVAWQGTVRDTDGPGSDAIVERVLRIAAPGRIVLLHDNPTTRGHTAEAIGRIVAGCRARGLEPIAL
jgi:peptidoglycan/xylan/chitin deacetylase (PgdA/CDA1 family)